MKSKIPELKWSSINIPNSPDRIIMAEGNLCRVFYIAKYEKSNAYWLQCEIQLGGTFKRKKFFAYAIPFAKLRDAKQCAALIYKG